MYEPLTPKRTSVHQQVTEDQQAHVIKQKRANTEQSSSYFDWHVTSMSEIIALNTLLYKHELSTKILDAHNAAIYWAKHIELLE
jgi:hypothetical protein